MKSLKTPISVFCKSLFKRKLWSLGILFFIFGIHSVFAQTAENISNTLREMRFENIRVRQKEDKFYIAIENHVYRWEPNAIADALDTIVRNTDTPSEIYLILLEYGIPQYLVNVNSGNWKDFRNGMIPPEKMEQDMKVTWDAKNEWQVIKSVKSVNSSTGKSDLTFYPQFSFENTRLSKIYETQFNIAPAVENSLWKGNKIIGQVIFPLHNELGYEGDFIRPGYLTVSQEFRLPKKWMGQIAGGNFNKSRYGLGMYLWHPFKNENWKIEFNAGMTGFSHFYDDKWTHGNLNTFTWSSSVSWYYSHFNLVLKGGVAQYIYNDMGLFASCTRLFNETAIGFYAQLNEFNFNGGFQVTFALPWKKRLKRKYLRLNIPNYYELSYNSGTELYYGQNFNIKPDDNQIKSYKFTSLIKHQIINCKK